MYKNNFFPNIDFYNAIEYLHISEKIVITTHVNPDGDAVGSSMALYYALKDMGKSVNIIVNDSECPEMYKFLPKTQKIKRYQADIHNPILYSADVIIVVDLSNLSRIKNMEEVVRQSPVKKILIDHHVNSDNFANYNLSDSSAIATGELVFAMLEQANIKITKEIADALYCAIYTDSGGFRFSNTSPRTHKITASLLKYGAIPNILYENIYNTNSLAKMQLQGLAMAAMEQYLNGQLTFICVRKEMFKQTNTTNEDTENLSQVPLSVKGTKVGILIIEYDENIELRVSLRSKGNINILSIALKFGGGGHINASGCRLQNMSVDEAKQVLTEEVRKILLES
jgi:phosphoesterase RecJ-like protein